MVETNEEVAVTRGQVEALRVAIRDAITPEGKPMQKQEAYILAVGRAGVANPRDLIFSPTEEGASQDYLRERLEALRTASRILQDYQTST